MSCEKRDKVLAFLQGKLSEEEGREAEAHLEDCPECSAMVEGYMQKAREIEIPRKEFQGKENELKEQAVHYEKGTRRIVVFTIVGMVMGWFSKIYVMQDFFLFKVILCIPYKVSEILYHVFMGNNALLRHPDWGRAAPYPDGIFPLDMLIRVFAEYVTPVLIGGAIYGSLAYFTGDKRIFTLRRYLKFGAVWAAIIAVYMGAMFAIAGYRAQQGDRFVEVKAFFLWTETSGRRVDIEAAASGADSNETWGAKLYGAMTADGGPEALAGSLADMEGAIPLTLYTGPGGLHILPCLVNTQECLLQTYYGSLYRIPKEFADMLQTYYDKRDRVQHSAQAGSGEQTEGGREDGQ